MKQARLLLWGLIFTSVTLVSIAAIDAQIARMIEPSVHWWKSIAGPPMTVIEIAFGFPISKWLTGAVILLAAIGLFFIRRHRPTAWLLLFVSLSQLITRLIAGVLKNVFLRERPYEIGDGRWFIEGGSSFPSGHAGHFWGLFFALAIAFPKTRIPFLILALFVSLARVVVNDHYVSDVLASGAIAAFVTYGVGWVVLRRVSARVEDVVPDQA
jgi:membrane-associated phospholipid phosphatase